MQLATIPNWLDGLLQEGDRPQAAALVGETIPEGQRNETLTSLAGTMRRRGMSQNAIEAALLAENRCCGPPLPEHEVLTIARSVSQYAPAPDADPRAEIARLTADLDPETPLAEKLKGLATLVPALAGLSNLEAESALSCLGERLKLPPKVITALRRDVVVARKIKERGNRKGRGSKDASCADLSELGEAYFLHPAVDFQNGHMSLGFRVPLPDGDTGLLLVLSDGQVVRAELNAEAVEVGRQGYRVMKNAASPFLQDVWNLERLKAFLEHPTRPSALYVQTKQTLRQYLDLPEPAYGLLTAWIVGTYFSYLFSAFPFLHFIGPKESGKSKTLEAKRCLCFNAFKGRDISAAALGDTCEGQRGTVLIDQAERLGQGQDGNINLVGLLADSYKRGGGKRRVVEVNKTSGRSVLEFSTYGPKAFASTKRLDPDLEDRCCRVPMTRTRKRLPDLEGWEPVWGELRDKLYRFALMNFKEVQAHYQTIPGDGTRATELWRPLGAVLQALDVSPEELTAVREFFLEATQETRHEPTGWELTLLEALQDRASLEVNVFEMTPEEILQAMSIEGEERPGPKWIGDALSRYHLFQKKERAKRQGKKCTLYFFTPARLLELCRIYLREPPPNDMSLLSPDDFGNNSMELEGTREKPGTRPHLSPSEPSSGGHEGSCPPQMTCPPHLTENTEENSLGQEGHEKTGGLAKEKFAHLDPGLLEGLEEVDF